MNLLLAASGCMGWLWCTASASLYLIGGVGAVAKSESAHLLSHRTMHGGWPAWPELSSALLELCNVLRLHLARALRGGGFSDSDLRRSNGQGYLRSIDGRRCRIRYRDANGITLIFLFT